MGQLAHSVADIFEQVLVDLGLGSAASANTSWPVFCTTTPNEPDNVIVLKDQTGRIFGREQIEGEIQEDPGLQVLVRAVDHRTGFAKMSAIANAFDKLIRNERVTIAATIAATEYLISTVTRVGTVLPLGKEVALTKRELFSLNAVVSLRQIT